MARERWGTFSVIDHRNVGALVPEILLYDRLVIPTPYDPYSNFDDSARWEANGWDPQGLQRRLDQLGDLAIKKAWNQQRQEAFRTKFAELKQTQAEVDPYRVTPWILAQELPQSQPGLSTPIVVAAYSSEADFKRDFTLILGSKEFEATYLGVLLVQRLAFPIVKPDDENTLKKTIDLAKNPHFSQKRRNLYAWQENIINQGSTAKEAMGELEELIDAYNQEIKKVYREVFIKYVCTVAGLAFSIAGGAIVNPLLAVGAVIPLIQLVTVDGKAVTPLEKSSPVAMFHDIDKKLG